MKINIKILILILVFLLILMVYLCLFKKRNTYINNVINVKRKKIAFCFLIYDKINHESLWNSFFKNIDKNKYTIYIHYKNNKNLRYFDTYKLSNNKTIPTKWCGSSLVEAQLILLKEAIKDPNNHHFIFVSNSCIPVKSFDYIYNYLDTTKSYFNMTQPFVNMLSNIKAYKATQWCILNRMHTNTLLSNKNIIRTTYVPFKKFKVRGCPDEYSIISSLYKLENNLKKNLIVTNFVCINATTFTSFNHWKNYKDFKNSIKKGSPNNYSYICPEELDYIVTSKSLFARKFSENCTGLNKLKILYK